MALEDLRVAPGLSSSPGLPKEGMDPEPSSTGEPTKGDYLRPEETKP